MNECGNRCLSTNQKNTFISPDMLSMATKISAEDVFQTMIKQQALIMDPIAQKIMYPEKILRTSWGQYPFSNLGNILT